MLYRHPLIVPSALFNCCLLSLEFFYYFEIKFLAFLFSHSDFCKGKLRDQVDVKRDEGKRSRGRSRSGVRELRSRILLINNAVMGVCGRGSRRRRRRRVAVKCGGTEKAALFTPAGDRAGGDKFKKPRQVITEVSAD